MHYSNHENGLEMRDVFSIFLRMRAGNHKPMAGTPRAKQQFTFLTEEFNE